MKKKTEYSTMTVMMVIFLLAMFVVLPPVMRVAFPAEEEEVSTDTKMLLTCSKNGTDTDPYSVTSATYFVNDVAEKNSINFFAMTNDSTDTTVEERVDEVITQQNVIDETIDSGIVATEGETTDGEDASGQVQRTITQELEFFRTLSGVNFTDNGTSFSVTITYESLNENSGNLELNNYLSSETEMMDFYTSLGYSCYTESF